MNTSKICHSFRRKKHGGSPSNILLICSANIVYKYKDKIITNTCIYIYVYTLTEVDRICDFQTYSHFTEVFVKKKSLFYLLQDDHMIICI